MNTKHPTLPRRTSLLSGMPAPGRLPRKPLRTGVGPSARDLGQTCRYSERIGLSDAELDQIAERINTARLADPAAADVDPITCWMGAPLAAMHKLLNEVASDAADHPQKGGAHRDDDQLFHDPAADVIDFGVIDFPT